MTHYEEKGKDYFCCHCGKVLMMHGPAPLFVCPGQSKKDVPTTAYEKVPIAGLYGDGERAIRMFDTGATRNLDSKKFDYEAFLSPVVLHRYAQYMHEHRKQKDGTLRDGDNWQRGIPQSVYLKSLIRHTMDFWRSLRGGKVVDPDTGLVMLNEELACAIMFNIMGWLHEALNSNQPREAK